ncbi:unnamed protein product [Rodentolepis nana]|uniref:Presenilin n=1 Tax=Rodentolepis nana TaxID=102285 RepID=A0A0R3T6U3_RODNA|nr:unnamed protein product [Rodentolepis nana]
MLSNGDDTIIEQHSHLNNETSSTFSHRSHEQSESTYSPLSPKLIIRVGAKQIISLFIPVSICMFFVAFISKNVPFFSKTDAHFVYAPFNTPNADIGTQTWQTLVNVAIILTFVIVTTFILVLLFKFKCYKFLTGWLIMATFAVVFLASFTFFAQLLQASRIFFDNITFAILLWNFGVLGLISIHWRGPLVLQQAYLIFNSVVVALTLLRFLPKWTCWVLLGAISIWDLIAVLCPRGPLRMLVEMAQERNLPLFPAIIYSTAAAYIADSASPSSPTTTRKPREEAIPLKTADERTGAQTLVNLNEMPPASLRRRHPESSSLAPTHDSGYETRGQTHPNGAMNDGNRVKSNRSHQPIDGSNSHQEWHDSSPPLTTGTNEALSHEMVASGDQLEAPNEWLRDVQEDIIDREERGVKLGLGDFVFYSVLIGRASLDGDILTAISCYVAILVGMCLTIVALAVARRALPALPISIICGIIFYFSTAAVITPFIHAVSERRLFF